jgi:hypothetical protein
MHSRWPLQCFGTSFQRGCMTACTDLKSLLKTHLFFGDCVFRIDLIYFVMRFELIFWIQLYKCHNIDKYMKCTPWIVWSRALAYVMDYLPPMGPRILPFPLWVDLFMEHVGSYWQVHWVYVRYFILKYQSVPMIQYYNNLLDRCVAIVLIWSCCILVVCRLVLS